MAKLAAILGRAVYLDTNIFIYTVEGYAPEEAFLRELFAALEDGRFTAITSELSLAEVLVKPFELGHEDVAAAYTELLTASDRLAVLSVDRAILVEAARQRAGPGHAHAGRDPRGHGARRRLRSVPDQRWPSQAAAGARQRAVGMKVVVQR